MFMSGMLLLSMGDEESNHQDEMLDEGHVFVFDRRQKNGKSVKISLGGLFNYHEFRSKIKKEIGIQNSDDKKFVIVTTNRLRISSNQSYENSVESGDTLYILRDANQDLVEPVMEHIEYLPHYDTLVKSGMYEYYESAGQNPLCFAFAELIDNALTATAFNEGPREIKLTLYFDSASCVNAVCVSDNGSGMTSKDLNNWAVYRLSKFNRSLKPGKTSEMLPMLKNFPRSLNSDISYFGVGGKQAIFFIGSSTTVITKKKQSRDVHEMTLSKEDFEVKEKRKDKIYSGYIKNRQIGDSSHVSDCRKVLKEFIDNEQKDSSFTHVVITNIDPKHTLFLRHNLQYLCRQLAHIYHYYLHGPMGNINSELDGMRLASPFRHMDIQLIVKDKGSTLQRISLRDIDDDLESLFLKSTSSLFEFIAQVEGMGKVEGVLRYHPFLYDKETFPDVQALDSTVSSSQAIADAHPPDTRGPRGDKPIFECFWNGRLIPYTKIDSLDWCIPPKKKTNVKQECYYRISGALFTDDSFQVSTNKLTFIDLEGKLREKTTIFSKIVMGQEQRTIISRAFNEWVKHCHEVYDKQIKFLGFVEKVHRKDVAQKRNQGVWSVYEGVEWDGKIFKVGQLIRTMRTLPALVGRIRRFYLYGDHNGEDVFATGGEIEFMQEPEALYGDIKVLPLEKLDRSPSEDVLREFIQEEELKLPASLMLQWPDGNNLVANSKVAAGSTIGPVKVDILNGRNESIHKLPGERIKKLLIELKVIYHCEKSEDRTVLQLTCQHGGKSWPYWFRKIVNVTDIGRHTLQFRTILSDTNPLKSLPSVDIPFFVTEADPSKLIVGLLETPLKVGVPFQMPLTLQDGFGNIVKLKSNDCLPTISAPEFTFKFSGTKYCGNALIIRDVTAEGLVSSTGGKDCNVKISFPKLKDLSQSTQLRFFPGPPNKLEILQDTIEIENGDTFKFDMQIKDKVGNITSQPKLSVTCKVTGIPGYQPTTCDCSSTGMGSIQSHPINLKYIDYEEVLTAKMYLNHYKDVRPVYRTIVVRPSSKASKMKVFYVPSGASEKGLITNGQRIQCVAGESISDLYIAIFDEADRQLEIDLDLASKIKVNWAGKMSKEELRLGKLPYIKAPTSTDDTKYCQVTCIDRNGGIEHAFSLKAIPAAPSTLKLSCENTKFRMSEPVMADIAARLHDDYGNFIVVELKDLDCLSVSGDGLKKELVKKSLCKGSFILQNIYFENGLPGPRTLCIQWKSIECYQKLEMLPGPAADLVLIDFDTSEPLQILNGNLFPKPIRIQLVDAAGNVTNDKNVRCILQRDANLKLSPLPAQQRTDMTGQAVFDNFTASAPKGIYQIIPRAILSSGNKDGPLVLVSVEPDASKPVELVASFGKQKVFTAGATFPDIDAHVLSEEGNPIASVRSKELVLKLWSDPLHRSMVPPANASLYSASPGRKDEPKDHFYFRGIKAPERCGKYSFIIQYVCKNFVKLSTQKIGITICPGPPSKLVPVTIPATPTASNSKKAAPRNLVKNLKFELKDIYGNTAGLDFQATLKVSVEDDGKDVVPCLQGGQKGSLYFDLSKGTCTVHQLMLEPDTEGIDGQEYIILFEVIIADSRELEVEPFRLSFLFYDDVQKQKKMRELTKERDKLIEKINTFTAAFNTMSQRLKDAQAAHRESTFHEQNIRRELGLAGYREANLLKTTDDISRAISKLKQTKSNLERQPRRSCSLAVGIRDKDIIGKVAHLALVQEDDVARVLSWHMASDMDCIITTTTEQATKVYKHSNGRQQVLPLDSIYKKGLSDWKKPLPHERYSGIKPHGTIKYARDFLMFPEHEQQCKLIFSMLLGDTIVTDSLEIATKYRQEVVKHTFCPTVLTRNGERIRSNGKFGGLQNKAPPLDRLNGAVFSCPLPPLHKTICAQIDLLSNLETVLFRVNEHKLELKDQLADCQSEKTEADYSECLTVESRLHKVESQLGITHKLKSMPASLAQFFDIQASFGSSRTAGSKRTLVYDNGCGNHNSSKRSRLSYEKESSKDRFSNYNNRRSSGNGLRRRAR